MADYLLIGRKKNSFSSMSMLYGFTLKERKKNTELRELLGLEPVSLVIKRGRLSCLDMYCRTLMMVIGSIDV